MTTIAIKDGHLAVDIQATANYVRVGDLTKWRAQEIGGELVVAAACGDAELASIFFDWVSDGMPTDKKPELGDCFRGFVCRGGKVLYVNTKVHPYPIEAEFHAAGSGGDIALGAMCVGATAGEAVAAAGRLDTGTGQTVEVIRLSDGKKIS